MRCSVSTCSSRRLSIVLGMALHLKWSAREAAVEIDGAIDDAFRKLGYPSVKQEQREAVRCVLLGYDCFVTVPTGFGKSAIFHALHLYALTIFEQLCDSSPSSSVPCVVVISPRVAQAFAHFSIAR